MSNFNKKSDNNYFQKEIDSNCAYQSNWMINATFWEKKTDKQYWNLDWNNIINIEIFEF